MLKAFGLELAFGHLFVRADGTRELTSEPKAFGLELRWPFALLAFATADCKSTVDFHSVPSQLMHSPETEKTFGGNPAAEQSFQKFTNSYGVSKDTNRHPVWGTSGYIRAL